MVVIHGVGETEPGWINDYFIPRLLKRDTSLEFEEHSEVHSLPDLGRSRPNLFFKAYLRRAPMRSGSPITVMELFWADLSRTGHNPLTNLLVMLQLFYEAPLVLGAAFLRQKQAGLRAVLHSIVRGANWLLRWPITGLNASIFVVALGFLGIQKLRDITPIADRVAFNDLYLVCALLAALALTALWFARRNVHKGILLTDLALSTAIFSSVMLVVAVAAGLVLEPGQLQKPTPYLLFASKPILVLWWIWNHVVAAGILLLTVMAVGKIFKPAGQRLATLMRPASALGLSTIQGMIWKIVITLLWVLLISALVPGSARLDLCEGDIDACTQLFKLNADLFGIFVMNVTLAIALTLGALALVGVRSIVSRVRRKALLAGNARLPRLIISPWLVMLMFALTLVNFVLYFVPIYNSFLQTWFNVTLPFPVNVYKFIYEKVFTSGLMAYFVGTTSLLLFMTFFRAVQNASKGVLHIVRDLVDHQYTPEFTFSAFMLPARKQYRGRYPRRERIQKRFDALMGQIEKENCQRLILIAHSQGTVVLHDYLRSNRDDKTLAKTQRIDIVTVGSPLAHFYQHYFPSYEAVTMSANRLNPRLASWTNLYRIDDPIGARLNVVSDNFIVNEALPPGGHLDYWKDPRVCDVILNLIDPNRVKREDKPASKTAA